MRIDAKTCDWHIPTIGALGFLLWTTNRRRVKPNFDMRGEADIEAMLPTLVGLTEGAVDHGNSVEIVQNGALFDRPSRTFAARSIRSTSSRTSGGPEPFASALRARSPNVRGTALKCGCCSTTPDPRGWTAR